MKDSIFPGLNIPLAPRLKRNKEQPKIVFRRRLLWEEQGHQCAYCDVLLEFEDATIDHIKPKSKGGTKNLKNVVVVCHKCNFLKGDISSVAEANERIFIFAEFIARLESKGFLK